MKILIDRDVAQKALEALKYAHATNAYEHDRQVSAIEALTEELRLQPQPCRSPYCECELGACTHPGCYDARHTPQALG